MDLLIATHEAVGRYDEAAKRFINPALVERLSSTKEAQASSTIEGTEISLSEVFKQDAQTIKSMAEQTAPEQDYREIYNYRRALSESQKMLSIAQPLSLELIKNLHATLLNSVRGHDKMPGSLRDRSVHIGKAWSTPKEARYTPPRHEEVPGLMDNLLDYLNNYKEHNPFIKIAVFHYQFEAIHPFRDGNGRLGRLLIPLCLHREGLIVKPNLYLSAFFQEYRREYYEALHQVDVYNNWHEWLEFFISGVRYQAIQQSLRLDQIEYFYEQQIKLIPKLNSKYSQTIFDLLFLRPILSVRTVLNLTDIKQYPTANNLIQRLVKMGVLEEIKGSYANRSRLYAYQALLDILEKDPSELSPPNQATFL